MCQAPEAMSAEMRDRMGTLRAEADNLSFPPTVRASLTRCARALRDGISRNCPLWCAERSRETDRRRLVALFLLNSSLTSDVRDCHMLTGTQGTQP